MEEQNKPQNHQVEPTQVATIHSARFSKKTLGLLAVLGLLAIASIALFFTYRAYRSSYNKIQNSKLSNNVDTTAVDLGGVTPTSSTLQGVGLLQVNGDANITNNVTANSFSGGGADLTNLNANNITSGTLNDARLSPNVALLDASQTFTGSNTFTGNSTFTGAVVLPGTLVINSQTYNMPTSQVAGTLANDGSGNLTWTASAGCPTCFTNGGNSFGALTILGTLDNNSLSLITNGTTRLSFDTAGNATFTGTIAGNGSGITGLNGSNITSGTVADARLTSNVTLLGNVFNGALELVQLDATGNLPALNGAALTNLDASHITAGTLNDLRLSANVTLMGNTFNLPSKLVQLTGAGFLPALNASLLTNLNATNIASGTLSDSRLSANVALLNATNTFTANNTFSSGITTNSVTTTSGLTVGSTSQPLVLQGNGSTSITSTSGGHTTTLMFQGAPVGNITYHLDAATTPGTYDICSTIGNCASVGGAVTSAGGTNNVMAKFTGLQTIGDSSISDDGQFVIIQPTVSNSTSTLQVLSTTGSGSNVAFDVDTTNSRVGIGTATPGYAVDAVGDVNASTSLRVGGTVVCTVLGCLTSGGTGNYIKNSTSAQVTPPDNAANFAIQSAAASSIGGVIRGAAAQSADLQQWQNSGAAVLASVDANGNINTASQFRVGGVQISSTNLSDGSNLAKLNGTQSFTGVNTFQNTVDSTSAFKIQNAAGSSNLFTADTSNTRIGIGTATPGYTLDVNGDVNLSAGSLYRINGVAICGTSGTCAPSANSPYYIQNTTSQQANANFNIRSIDAGSITGVLQGAVGQSVNILQIQSGTGAVVAGFSNNGVLTLGNDNASPQAGAIVFQDGTGLNNFTNTLSTATLTSNRSISLPNDSISPLPDVICLQNSASCGFASSSGASGNYIQTGYSTGTASQSGSTITGVGTTFTSGMVGRTFIFADGTNAGTITAFTDATTLTVSTSQTVASQGFSLTQTADFKISGSGTLGTLTATGAISGVGVNSGSGLLQGTGGLTLTGTTNINTSGSSAINIGTGTYTGTTTIGNSGSTLVLASNAFNVSSAGAVSGVTTLTASGAIKTTSGTVQINDNNALGTVEKLRVNGPTTTDNLANVMFATDATTSKGLVIQAKASQTANLQEWQNSAGTALSVVNKDGWVGIGSSSAPSAQLMVTGNAGLRSSDGTYRLSFNAMNSSGTTYLGQLSGGIFSTGINNSGVGYYSLAGITTGNRNTGLGYFTNNGGSTTNDATAIGYNTLASNSSYDGETAIGSKAMQVATGGIYNTAIGASALQSVTSGAFFTSGNVGVGLAAGNSQTNAANNVKIGMQAGYAGLNSGVTAIGYNALFQENGGGGLITSYNTAFGLNAGYAITTATDNTIVGTTALAGLNYSFNVAIGINAAQYAAYSNVAVGSNSLVLNNFGTNYFDVVIGSQASYLSAGNSNVAIGLSAMYGTAFSASPTGSGNIAIGTYSMLPLTSGNYNIGIGYTALYGLKSGDQNTAVGYAALNSITGSNSTALGYQALLNATGASSVALGSTALAGTVAGNNNVGIGFIAGQYSFNGSTANTGGDTSVYLGYQVRSRGTNDSNEIVIGKNAIGSATTSTTGSNITTIGAIGTTQTALRGKLGLGVTSPVTQLDVLSADAAVTAGAFVSGKAYTIQTVGTTDFTLVGATANTVGLTFIATGAGSGTGTAAIPTAEFNTATLRTGNASQSGFTITIPTGIVNLNATAATANNWYKILTVGSTNYTLCGASANTVGTVFKRNATACTGTGTVTDWSYVGRPFVFADGTSAGRISNINSATSLTSTVTQTVASQGFSIGNGVDCVVSPISSSGFFSCSSDARLKTNVLSITDPTDVLTKLRGVNFNWISQPDGLTQSGFIAQELMDVLPNAVSADSQGYLVANYQAIIPYLVEGFKKQQTQIDNLTATTPDVIKTLADANAIEIKGDLTIGGNLVVGGNTSFSGDVTFSSDSAGTVTMPAGTTTKHITFTKTLSKTPVVSATPKDFITGSFKVTNESTTGFDIQLEQSQSGDSVFNWDYAFIDN